MDNTGVSGGASRENGTLFGAQEKIPEGSGDEFAEFVDSREDLKPQMEMPAELVDNDNTAEVVAEMQSSAQLAPTTQAAVVADDDEKKDQELRDELSMIKIAPEAESLPRAYEKVVNNIVYRNRKNPSRLVKEMDIARWALMEKVFGRKRGDGFNGGGA